MLSITRKSLDRPDGVREFPNRTDALVTVAGTTVARAELRPGWRWSSDIRPIVGTPSCELAHVGYILTGVMHVEADDGTAIDLAAGDVFDIAPGHDAWVVGTEPCLFLDWTPKPDQAATAATRSPNSKGTVMPLFMDVHNLDGSVKIEDVAKAHLADLEKQGAHDVNYLQYWVNEDEGKIFCLVEAPSAAAANTVHREAHGLVADALYQVQEGS